MAWALENRINNKKVADELRQLKFSKDSKKNHNSATEHCRVGGSIEPVQTTAESTVMYSSAPSPIILILTTSLLALTVAMGYFAFERYYSKSGSPMDQFISYVKLKYKDCSMNLSPKWPPRLCREYIKLALIDRKSVQSKKEYEEITECMVRTGSVDVIMEKKIEIHIDKIACNLPEGKHLVLVEGAPGVGKSTFAQEFCWKWKKRKIGQQYDLVLLLRLREERIRKAESLGDLIYHPSRQVREGVEQELVDSLGANTLFILEGFDELPEECRRENSVFLELIRGKLLPKATVLVTSRPWATKNIHEKYRDIISQHIEILGFTNQQISECIKKSELSDDQSKDLMQYLEKHPQIKGCMYIPLNAAIVVGVYRDSQEDRCILPTTSTELYMALTQTLLYRYLRAHPDYGSKNIRPVRSFEKDLPPEVYQNLLLLCDLAYSGIASGGEQIQLIFSGLDLPSDFESLGFMDSVTELYVTQGAVVSYNYLHFSVQEFLAAVHISIMSPDRQLEHLQQADDGRYEMVLRFLAGLTKFKDIPVESIRDLLPTPTKEDDSDTTPCDMAINAQHTNWLFESQSPDLISALLKDKTVKCDIINYQQPMDYYCLGYTIVHSQCQWVIKLFGGSEEKVEMLVAGTRTRAETSARVVGLEFYYTSATVMNTLFTGMGNMIHLKMLRSPETDETSMITWPDLSELTELYLYYSRITNWRLGTLLNDLCSHVHLITLDVSGVEFLESENWEAIKTFLTSTTSLHHLIIRGDEYSDCPIQYLEVVMEAMVNNPLLPLRSLELAIDGYVFSDTATPNLSLFISNSTTLQSLTVSGCTFTVHRLLELLQATHHSPSLLQTQLEYLKCKVDVGGDIEANDTERLLTENNDIIGKIEAESIQIDFPRPLDLSQWSIGDKRAYTVANLLYFTSVLRELNLSSSGISDSGATAIATALQHNSTLKELNMSGNSISDRGACAIATALQHNSNLKLLILSGNSISDGGATAIATALEYNYTVGVLDLSGNSMNDTKAVQAAFHPLTHRPHPLHRLRLYLSRSSSVAATDTTHR